MFLMETWRKRPPAAFKLGGVLRNIPGMFFWVQTAESSQSASAILRPPGVLSSGAWPISDKYTGKSRNPRETRNR